MCYKKPNILIIGDKPENLEIVSVILLKACYKIEIIVNGLFAMAQTPFNEYDLVIMDLSERDLNGNDFFSMIKTTPLSNLPVIFINPTDKKRIVLRSMNIAGYDFISIPIDESDLLTRVENQLQLRQFQNWN